MNAPTESQERPLRRDSGQREPVVVARVRWGDDAEGGTDVGCFHWAYPFEKTPPRLREGLISC